MDNWTTSKTVEDDNQAQFDPSSLPPVGLYMFELIDKEPDEPQKAEYNKSGDKYRARFHFKIVDEQSPWAGFVAKVRYNISLNESSFLTPVVEALVGRKLEATDRLGWKDEPNAVHPVSNKPSPIVGIGFKRMMAVLNYDETEDKKRYPKLQSPFPVQKPGQAPVVPPASAGPGASAPAPF